MLALAAVATTIQAQTTSFGLRAGLNSATINFEDETGLGIEPDSRIGLDLALMASLGITEEFSIQPELHFIQKGFRLDLDFGVGDVVESQVLVNYLEIPVLAKYAFGGETLQGFVNGGPSIGYGLSGKSKAKSNGVEEEEDLDFKEDGVKRTDFSFVFGGGLSIKAGPATVFLDIRYLLGLTNIDDSGDDDSPKQRNRGLGFGLGVLFPIGE
ncbi:MAG: outer membrane beta-barrel protein [Bacteroidetes bacterium]|nr:outer membrane beta-barrel protein [Bacteroidota bacterium]